MPALCDESPFEHGIYCYCIYRFVDVSVKIFLLFFFLLFHVLHFSFARNIKTKNTQHTKFNAPSLMHNAMQWCYQS